MGIKHKVNEKFFDKWNSEMAYVLGFFCADGNMDDCSYMRAKYVKFSNTELELIKIVKKAMGSEHVVRVELPKANEKMKYILRMGSHKLYFALGKLGMHPHKSLTLKFPSVPKKYLADFVRGYLDGDGCVSIEQIGKGAKRHIRRLLVIFTSGSREFLWGLMVAVNGACNLSKNVVYNSHRSLQLRYSTRDGLKILYWLYKDAAPGLFLKRKFDKFISYLQFRSRGLEKRKVNKMLKMATW